jgi:hypothetical protein
LKELGSCLSSEPDLVMVQVITPVAVVAEALAAGVAAGGVGVQWFAETLKAGKAGRDAGVQIDQYLVMAGQGFVADKDGCQLRVGLAEAAVGQEALIVVGPEQAVEVLRLAGVRDPDMDADGLLWPLW